jgi:hypothetical protein
MLYNLKFFRDYIIRIENSEGQMLEVKFPYTIDFTCENNIFSSVNSANFKIYNLDKETRQTIYKDMYDTLNFRRVEFRIKYLNLYQNESYINNTNNINRNYNVYSQNYNINDYSLIWAGNIRQCFSYRNKTEMITEISAYDGDFATENGFSNFSFVGGTDNLTLFKTFLNNLPNSDGMQISPTFANGRLQKGRSFIGNTSSILRGITGNNFYFNNNIAECLPLNEYFIDINTINNIYTLSSETGLIEAPQRENASIVVKSLFAPELTLGEVINLQSEINPFMNGVRKIVGLHHSGTISGAICGNAETKIHVWYGAEVLKSIQGIKINATAV